MIYRKPKCLTHDLIQLPGSTVPPSSASAAAQFYHPKQNFLFPAEISDTPGDFMAATEHCTESHQLQQNTSYGLQQQQDLPVMQQIPQQQQQQPADMDNNKQDVVPPYVDSSSSTGNGSGKEAESVSDQVCQQQKEEVNVLYRYVYM